MNEQGEGLQAYPVHLQPNLSSSVSLFPYKGLRFLDTRFRTMSKLNRVASTFNPRQYFQSLEISKVISYVLRGIKRAISRKLVKISDGRVSRYVDRKKFPLRFLTTLTKNSVHF